MTCSGHADGKGSAHCSQCRITGCGGCLELVHGRYFCTNCLLETLDRVESDAVQENAEVDLHDVVFEARRRSRRNWILTGVASIVAVPGMFGTIISDPGIPLAIRPVLAPVCSIGIAYLIWAALWGIPVTWRWWKGLFRGTSFFIVSSPFGWAFLAGAFFTIPLYFGYLYGVFGGAIHEYRKNRRIAATAL